MSQNKVSTYKDFVFALISLALIASIIHTCNLKHKFAASDTVKDNLITRLEVERMLFLDSVDIFNEQLQIEREALPRRLNDYSKLPVKGRIKLITKIDPMAVLADTMAILSLHGIDSVNKLTIHYQSCVVQSAIKDTLITNLTNVVQADSVIIESQKKQAKAQKKAAKIKVVKAAVMSGLVGVIVGLVIL